MLERLARTMYRRRRRVLVAWIVALIGTFALAARSEVRSTPSSSCPAPRARPPSTCSTSRASATARYRETSSSGPTRASRTPPCRARWRTSSGRSRTKIPNVSVVSPYSEEGARQIGPNDPSVAYAEVNFADRSNEAFLEDGKAIKAAGRPGRRPRSRDRVRRRHVRHEPDQRRHRGRRSPRRDGHPADRLRLRDRDGPADRHRAVRHRHGNRDRADPAQLHRHARLHHRRRRDGRPRRRDRLRAVHRHAVPGEPHRRSRSGTERRARGRHRRPRGVVRGIHRDHLGARPVAHEDVDHARRVHRDRGRCAHHHDRVDHAPARAARLRRAQHRQVEDRSSHARPGRPVATPPGTGGAA